MIRLPTSIEWPRFARQVSISLACVVTFVSVHAWADPTPAERNLASALFDQGRTLMAEGKVDEACVKLAESQRLDPGGGTLLNVALCHVRQGKYATALTEFRDARTMARKDGRADREAAANAEIEKLEPLLSKISVIVPEDAKIPGLVIDIDGLPLPEVAWSTPFAVDPGTRVVTAKAPGYREWRSVVEIGKTGGTADVNLPKLEKDTSKPSPTGSSISTPAMNTPTGPDAPVEAPKSAMRSAGFVVGGVGLAFLAAGAITGGLAIQKNGAADAICPTNECNDAGAIDLSHDALTFAHVSTATFGIGIAGLVAGTVMVVAAPKKGPAKMSLSVGPQFVSVTGRF